MIFFLDTKGHTLLGRITSTTRVVNVKRATGERMREWNGINVLRDYASIRDGHTYTTQKGVSLSEFQAYPLLQRHCIVGAYSVYAC